MVFVCVMVSLQVIDVLVHEATNSVSKVTVFVTAPAGRLEFVSQSQEPYKVGHYYHYIVINALVIQVGLIKVKIYGT